MHKIRDMVGVFIGVRTGRDWAVPRSGDGEDGSCLLYDVSTGMGMGVVAPLLPVADADLCRLPG